MSSAKWHPFCLGLNELTSDVLVMQKARVSTTMVLTGYPGIPSFQPQTEGLTKSEQNGQNISQTSFWKMFPWMNMF